MNNKGFTLIELLATIILLSIIISITATSVVGLINSSKENSYKILIENIKIGAQAYFEECENVNIIGSTTIDCNLSDNTTTITLDNLLKYGFLKSSYSEGENKIIENPKNNENIGCCKIKIKKNVIDSSVIYQISKIDDPTCDLDCPEY